MARKTPRDVPNSVEAFFRSLSISHRQFLKMFRCNFRQKCFVLVTTRICTGMATLQFWKRNALHHPSGVGIDGGCEIFPFNLLFGDVLWKFVLRNITLGSLVSEKKSSSTMKEGLDEVVGPGLSDSCLQISDSYSFRFLGLRFCPDSKRVTNARVQEDGCFSSPTPRQIQAERGTEQSFISFFGG